jgi:hypothetical protein
MIRKIGATIGVMFGVALLTIAALFSGWRLKRVQTASTDWFFAVLLVVALVFGCVLLVLKFILSGR